MIAKILLSANTDWYLYNFRMALAKQLNELDYEVVFVSPVGDYASRFEKGGIRWIRWNVSRNKYNLFVEVGVLLSLLRIYRQEEPDIVHHHTIKPVIYGSIAARLAGVPKIVNSITGRGYVYQSRKFRARLLKKIVTFFYRAALRFPNSKIIFENQFDRLYFIENDLVDESNTYLIEGVGVDPVRYSPKPDQDSTPLVLLCGRMLWDKGVDVFVDAARLVKLKVDARFVLVGRPDPGNPESIAEKVLDAWNEEGVIEWWGWHSDMAAVYAQAHIVVLPTRYGEGVPTALIEGAACGKPLVASDIPGCRAVVEDEVNGFLLSKSDPSALAEVLERLISSPELRKKMGEDSRRIFLNKFTQNQINQATVQVYEKSFDKVRVNHG